MSNTKYTENAKEIFMITFATVIIAAAVYFFLIPSHVTVGSISALAMVLANFIPAPISAITMVMNVVLLIFGFIFIGRDFGAKTVYTSILLPICLGAFEVLFPNNSSITGDAFQDTVCYIFLVSVGLAMLFNRNASSGGLDIIAKFLNKYFHMELGKAMSLSGMLAALSSVFVYDKKIVALSVLGTYVSGMVLDHFIFGLNIKRRVCIISDKEDEIKEYILKNLHSGATIYEAIGAYGGAPRREIVTIVNKSEYSQLMTHIGKVDKDAFVTIYNVNEIMYKPKA